MLPVFVRQYMGDSRKNRPKKCDFFKLVIDRNERHHDELGMFLNYNFYTGQILKLAERPVPPLLPPTLPRAG